MRRRLPLIFGTSLLLIAGIVVIVVLFVVGGGKNPPPARSYPVTVISPPAAMSIKCGPSEAEAACRSRAAEVLDTLNQGLPGGG